MIAFRHWTCGTFIANKYIQERQSAVKTISDTSEASRLFDRQKAAGAVSLRKSHDIVILSFCNIVKGQAN